MDESAAFFVSREKSSRRERLKLEKIRSGSIKSFWYKIGVLECKINMCKFKNVWYNDHIEGRKRPNGHPYHDWVYNHGIMTILKAGNGRMAIHTMIGSIIMV